MNTRLSCKTVLACLAVWLVPVLFVSGLNPAVPDAQVPEQALVVPLGGNTWKNSVDAADGHISQAGISGWTSPQTAFITYVRFARKGRVRIWLHLKTPEAAPCRIRVKALGRSHTLQVQGSTFKDWYVGEWLVRKPGYVAFTISGLSRTGTAFADMASLKCSGTAVDPQAAFVKNNEGNFFYWGRRGPSVHLSYALPENRQIEWFYNEVTVPRGNDVIGSYFMANGFAEGYFGMQVNSETERRILFSVWSPFHTDDPASIPADQKIKLLGKGPEVYTGEFGNEGSGGQSYLRFPWKAGNTYRFLLQARPSGQDHTRYSAYFFAPEEGSWRLIARFERPRTYSYIKRPHSFLENFKPEYGHLERRVLFTNQWVRDTQGQWTELTSARFTGDNTAVRKYRMDHGGGLRQDAFYLRNCGFFSDFTPLKTSFERTPQGKAPRIDFQNLPH